MDKVENGIVINLSIGMNVMSLCVKVRQVNFSEPKPWNGNTNTLEKSREICRKNLVEEIQIGEKKTTVFFWRNPDWCLKNLQSVLIFALLKITLVFQVLGEDWRCGTWKVFGVPNAFSQGIWESLNPPMTPVKESVNLPRNQVGGGNFCGPQK